MYQQTGNHFEIELYQAHLVDVSDSYARSSAGIETNSFLCQSESSISLCSSSVSLPQRNMLLLVEPCDSHSAPTDPILIEILLGHLFSPILSLFPWPWPASKSLLNICIETVFQRKPVPSSWLSCYFAVLCFSPFFFSLLSLPQWQGSFCLLCQLWTALHLLVCICLVFSKLNIPFSW